MQDFIFLSYEPRHSCRPAIKFTCHVCLFFSAFDSCMAGRQECIRCRLFLGWEKIACWISTGHAVANCTTKSSNSICDFPVITLVINSAISVACRSYHNNSLWQVKIRYCISKSEPQASENVQICPEEYYTYYFAFSPFLYAPPLTRRYIFLRQYLYLHRPFNLWAFWQQRDLKYISCGTVHYMDSWPLGTEPWWMIIPLFPSWAPNSCQTITAFTHHLHDWKPEPESWKQKIPL